MFGTVVRGRKDTRFRLEVMLEDGYVMYQAILVSNSELDLFPKLYGYTLDKMTAKLDERLIMRYRSWMRQ